MQPFTLAKSFIDGVAHIPWIRAWGVRSAGQDINIIYYHFAGPSAPHYASYYVGCTIERFERELLLLKQYFDFCELSDWLRDPDQTHRLERPRLAITFDDGLDLVASGVADVLQRVGARATVFVLTNSVDNRSLMWAHKLSAVYALAERRTFVGTFNDIMRERALPVAAHAGQVLIKAKQWPMREKDALAQRLWEACSIGSVADYLDEYQPYLTRDGLRNWIDRGHAVGLHTASHPLCSRLDDDEIAAEITEPADQLRSWGLCDDVPFAYPFGDRLKPDVEESLFREGVISCALGTAGFSPRGTAPYRLERMPAEGLMNYHVFAKPILASFGRET